LRSADRFKEGDLNVGENSCIDRCAAKYWQARPAPQSWPRRQRSEGVRA
jgi:hypothetical protein